MEEADRQAIIRVKRQIAHLFKPNPWIFGADLALSSAVGWTAFVISLSVESIALSALCLFVSAYASYRAIAFTHEMEHFKDGDLPYFRGAWHVLCGMPFCMPHFIYRGLHRIHHSTRYYGTPEDPEYIPFVANGSFREPFVFIGLALLFPVIVALRYLVLGPLSLFSPALRRFVVTKASGFVMKLDYARKVPTGREMTIWRVEEVTTVIFVWTIVGSVLGGVLPAMVFVHWYAVLSTVMVLNAFRGLGATHRYASSGEVLSFEDHIFDCVNLNRFSILNELVGPVGLTYHATHHIFPGLPYYALPKAHRLLMQESAGEGKPLEFYQACQWSTITQALAKMIRLTRDTREGRPHASVQPLNIDRVAESKPTVAAGYPDF